MVETFCSRDQLFLNARSRTVDPEDHGAQKIFIGVKGTDKGGLHSQGIFIFPEGQADDVPSNIEMRLSKLEKLEVEAI